MSTDQQLIVLRQAAFGELPESIDSSSAVPVQIIQELVSSGHLEAIDVSSFDGPTFLDSRITTAGREYLRVLEERVHATSLTGKAKKVVPAVVKWVFGIIAALVAAFLIKQFVG